MHLCAICQDAVITSQCSTMDCRAVLKSSTSPSSAFTMQMALQDGWTDGQTVSSPGGSKITSQCTSRLYYNLLTAPKPYRTPGNSYRSTPTPDSTMGLGVDGGRVVKHKPKSNNNGEGLNWLNNLRMHLDAKAIITSTSYLAVFQHLCQVTKY